MFEVTDSGEGKGQGKVENPTPEWVAEQCERFEKVLAGFTAAMREAFRIRAAEGRARWEDPAAAERLQMDLLAHAYYRPLLAGEEAHVANFAAFLWALRQRAEIDRFAAAAAGHPATEKLAIPQGGAGRA